MTRTATSIRYALSLLLACGALNAFAGGYYGLSGAPDVPVEWLAGSPFEDYFVPSLILFVVVGGALSFAALAVLAGFHIARRSALIAGTIVLGWIIVQVAIIGYISWMQPRRSSVGWPCWRWHGGCRRPKRTGGWHDRRGTPVATSIRDVDSDRSDDRVGSSRLRKVIPVLLVYDDCRLGRVWRLGRAHGSPGATANAVVGPR